MTTDGETLETAGTAGTETTETTETTKSATPTSEDAVQVQTGGHGSKKRKSKSMASRGPTALPKYRGTGFEEYYADPPIDPGEHKEERELYDPRIESCIIRYRARRRLDNERTMLFNRYLMLGGVDCQPRQFNSADGLHGTEGLTADDIRTMTANDLIAQHASEYSKYYASSNSHMWTVDFVAVVSGFLSVELRDLVGSSEHHLLTGVDMIDNFLRYLQIHDVCPEFASDIDQSRAICQRAKDELPNCRLAQITMPGQFNLACAKLFYGQPEHKALNDGLDPLDKAPSRRDAEEIFVATMTIQSQVAGEKATSMARDNLAGICIVKTVEMDLEVCSLVAPSEEMLQCYAKAGSADWEDCCIQPTGIVVAKHCYLEEGYANQRRPSEKELEEEGKEAFFLDAGIMELLVPGMKMRVVMHELNCDLSFVSSVKDLHPSFFTFLPQELMLLDWKEPKVSEREPASVDNPDADEEVEDKMAE